ncbi:MAG: hypothetical protein V1696_03145 [Candidatus Jorgensenbacteria bacterium]
MRERKRLSVAFDARALSSQGSLASSQMSFGSSSRQERRPETFHSYLGLLKHGNARRLKRRARYLCYNFSVPMDPHF